MSDREALLAAILANPDEDTPRLMFADWLDEHGDSPRAEFIRVQCELARQFAAEADLPDALGASALGGFGRAHDARGRIALLTRESELLGDHGDEWREGLPKYADNAATRRDVGFRRGFVGHVTVPIGRFTKSPAALWENHPVESILLRYAGGHDRRKIPNCRPLAALRDLELIDGDGDRGTLAPFAECPHLSELRTLGLGYLEMTDDGATALERSPYLKPSVLELDCRELGEFAFSNLLSSPFASRLRRLRPLRVGPWGPEAVALAPLTELRSLDLSACGCGDASATALARTKYLKRLVTLNLRHNALTDAALETLAAWPGLATVRALNLSHNSIGGGGVAALVRSPHFRPEHLELHNNVVGFTGAKALAAWPGLAAVVTLNLAHADLRGADLLTLEDSPHWRDIRHLRLGGNVLTRDVIDRLRARFGPALEG